MTSWEPSEILPALTIKNGLQGLQRVSIIKSSTEDSLSRETRWVQSKSVKATRHSKQRQDWKQRKPCGSLVWQVAERI
jgi:hypothetical protein